MSELKKKKKSIGGTVTVGMGNPVLDMKQFNKDAFPSLDDEINNENNVENSSASQEASAMAADATNTGNAGALGAGTGDGADAAGGGMSEELLHEKRETKRYYIRPQDIFCANKADVLKALIEVSEAGENCSVYTLKNLDDHDDVHELTNNDIIYYYDNDVLYDKNHVMVMDYDLFIKHEEERKNLGKSPAAITKSEYDQEYDDRMTKNTFVEDLQGKINYNTLKLALDRGEEVDLGSSSSAADFDTFSDGGMYANTTYVAYVDKDKYILGSTNWSDDGGEGSNKEVEFNTFDELFNELYNIDFDQCNIDLNDEHRPEEPEVSDNPFDQTFESYDIYGNKLTEAKEEEPKVCCICGEEYEGYGNNVEPYKTGYCCDACNLKFVIPARMQAMNSDKEDKEDKED